MVPVYDAVPQGAAVSQVAAQPEVAAPRPAYQRALFPDSQRVVQMPSFAFSEPPRTTRETSISRAPRSRRSVPGQHNLKLDSFDSQVEAVIYCDVPVALPVHRAMAAALDLSMVLIGLGLFLMTFHLAGGEIVLNRQTIPFFGIIGALVAVFYHFLFCISGGDTAGMKWTQLRLVNFDGHAPGREQRAYRMVGGCLSLVAAGLGLVWALVDEESLTWHDHMSKTFPSPDHEA
jgi:uncharacterized RDD family membrane protein YckC